jgi:putative protein kinase ArgK-like GTPase of G3E family
LKEQEEEVEEQRRRLLAKALLKTALESPGEEDEDEEIGKEDQNSLLVGIIGPPNVGKFALTNFGCFYLYWLIFSLSLSLSLSLHRELGEL